MINKFIVNTQIKVEIINWYNKSLIYLKGNLACILILVSSKLIAKNNKIFINKNKRIDKTQFQLFKLKNDSINFMHNFQHILIATIIGYEKKLRMGGRNFNFTIDNKILIVKVGLTYNIIRKLNSLFKWKNSRKLRVLRIKSNFLLKLSSFMASIRKKFKRNVYTGKGIRYRGERRIIKIMHKTRR